jgi:hypothetical protein
VALDPAAAFALKCVVELDFTPTEFPELAEVDEVPCGFPARATPLRKAAPNSEARAAVRYRLFVFINLPL